MVAGCRLAVLAGGMLLAAPPMGAGLPGVAVRAAQCGRVVLEAQVTEGRSFEQVFAAPQGAHGGPALKVVVQALASGWIVRVVPASGPWGEHDRAELATPPYRSPNPLLITTDFAFRAQDAIAWNPRSFRYAAGDAAFDRLAALYPRVLANDGAATAEAAQISAEQPEGEVRILDAELAPGTADQWRMAATVASHLDTTPHETAQGIAPSPLGRLLRLRLRLSLDLPAGFTPAAGLPFVKIPCAPRPTA